MRNVELRDFQLIPSGKPLHMNGEVDTIKYKERLDPAHRLHLETVLKHLQSVATSSDVRLHVLAVGSSTDLKSCYDDIDLVICPEDQETRSNFYNQVREKLEGDKHLRVLKKSPTGSAPIFNSPYVQHKLFVFPAKNTDGASNQIDMTFLSEHGGSFEDALLLHRLNGLSFCKLE